MLSLPGWQRDSLWKSISTTFVPMWLRQLQAEGRVTRTVSWILPYRCKLEKNPFHWKHLNVLSPGVGQARKLKPQTSRSSGLYPTMTRGWRLQPRRPSQPDSTKVQTSWSLHRWERVGITDQRQRRSQLPGCNSSSLGTCSETPGRSVIFYFFFLAIKGVEPDLDPDKRGPFPGPSQPLLAITLSTG